jgi:prophage regulatory protein
VNNPKRQAFGLTPAGRADIPPNVETLGDTKKGNPMHQSEPRRMLSEKQVLQLVPVSRSTLLRMEKAGRFPRSTYISPNRRIWFEDEIVGWQNAVDEFNPNRGRGKGRRRRASPA